MLSFYFFKYSLCTSILEMHQHGLLRRWKDESKMGLSACQQQQSLIKKPEKLRRLTISNYVAAFLVFGVGWALSIIAFIMEHVWALRSHR